MKLTKFHSVGNVAIYINLAELVSLHPSVDPNAETAIMLSSGQTIYVKEGMEYVIAHLSDVEIDSIKK